MTLYEIETFARETIAEHIAMYPDRLEGLTFAWDNTKNALGRCFYGTPWNPIK